jgi:hypothetical protein
VLELLGGLPTSWEVLQPSKPRLSLLYKEWTWEHYRKLNLTFFTPYTEGDMEGINSRWGGYPPQAWGGLEHMDGRPANLLGLHRLRAPLTYSTDLPWHVYEIDFENTLNPGWPTKEVGPANPTLARFSLGFVPCHPLTSYCLWLYLILDIMKICMVLVHMMPFHHPIFLKW